MANFFCSVWPRSGTGDSNSNAKCTVQKTAKLITIVVPNMSPTNAKEIQCLPHLEGARGRGAVHVEKDKRRFCMHTRVHQAKIKRMDKDGKNARGGTRESKVILDTSSSGCGMSIGVVSSGTTLQRRKVGALGFPLRGKLFKDGLGCPPPLTSIFHTECGWGCLAWTAFLAVAPTHLPL